MQKLQNFMEEKILPIANKIAQQKYLKAISAGMIAMMPAGVIGSIALLLISPPIASADLNPGILQTIMKGWEAIGGALLYPMVTIYDVCMTMGAILVSGGIAWALARHYKMEKEGFIPTALSILCFLVVGAHDTQLGTSFANLGGTGYFAAIIIALVSVEFYRFLIDRNVGVINLGNNAMIPPAITASFRGMIPSSIVLGTVAIVNWLVFVLGLNTTLPELMTLLMSPLVKAVDSIFGVTFFALLVGVLWWFGIHDTCITSPLEILWGPMTLANQTAKVAGTSIYALPHIATSGFWWTFLTIGGSGATLALAITLLTCKSKQLKTVGKLGIVPAIFNINEPIIFGLPIMLNPTLFIPFVLAMPVNAIITYLAMQFGIVGRIWASASWNMPTPIAAFLSTMDWKALVLNVLLIVVDFLLYYPFVKAYDKEKLAEETE